MMLGRAALLVAVVFIGINGSPVTQAPTAGPWPNVSTPQPTPNVWSDPCVNDFSPLRADAQSRGRAFQDAIKRKASSQELCTLIEAFYDAEAKVGTFLESHTSACHIPDGTVTTLRSNHNKTLEKKQQICICSADFLRLRTEYEKQQQTLQEAIKHRDSQEICKLYGSLTEAGNKLVAFAEGNAALCGTTDQMLSAAKSAYNRGLELKQQACAAVVNDRAVK
jgi:Skp family chaperone for outer membrane proteins